jgi:hypothetical protein
MQEISPGTLGLEHLGGVGGKMSHENNTNDADVAEVTVGSPRINVKECSKQVPVNKPSAAI